MPRHPLACEREHFARRLTPKTPVWGRNARDPPVSSCIAAAAWQRLNLGKPTWQAGWAAPGPVPVLHGKEGVRGSSPRVGFSGKPATAGFPSHGDPLDASRMGLWKRASAWRPRRPVASGS